GSSSARGFGRMISRVYPTPLSVHQGKESWACATLLRSTHRACADRAKGSALGRAARGLIPTCLPNLRRTECGTSLENRRFERSNSVTRLEEDPTTTAFVDRTRLQYRPRSRPAHDVGHDRERRHFQT